MVIGVDLRALQTGHKYRGIGEVAKQITSYILQFSTQEKVIPRFIFFEYQDDGQDPKELLAIPSNIEFSVKKLGPMPEKDTRGKWPKLKQALAELYGNPIRGAKECDVYLQFDYMFGVPRYTKTLLVAHDFIPLIFKKQYFVSAWVPFFNKAARSTIKTLYHNYKFKRVMKRSYRHAKHIIAVSECTKNDVTRFTGVPASRITVVYHGAELKETKTDAHTNIKLPTKPYLLFIGAGDARRRVEDLVAAFNSLKAEGCDIQLVLAGENFIRPENIPTPSVRRAVVTSSYKDDIICTGYISDQVKQQLFRDAFAFVYPTLYEGFGIPIIEAMLQQAPVITYKNSSIPEVAGRHALYAKDWLTIKKQVEVLMSFNTTDRRDLVAKALHHAQTFTWHKSAHRIFNIIEETGAK